MANKTKAKLKMLYLIWQELDDAETVVITNKKGVSTHIKRDCMFPVVGLKPSFIFIDEFYLKNFKNE